MNIDLIIILKTVLILMCTFNFEVKSRSHFFLHCQYHDSVRHMFNELCEVNPLSASITKWSNTVKLLFSVFDHFVGLALKGLILIYQMLLLRSRSEFAFVWKLPMVSFV